jgi:hypothetical protein
MTSESYSITAALMTLTNIISFIENSQNINSQATCLSGIQQLFSYTCKDKD